MKQATVAGNSELLTVLREIEKERNIPFEMLLEALEAALITAYKRHFGGEANAIVTIDRQTGEYKVYHRRVVVDEVADPKLEVTAKEAGASKYQVGDFFDEEVTPKDFGRIAAQTAKQVIVQRIREAERDTVYNKYSARVNDIVRGTVQRYEQRNMFVLLEGKDEALLPLSEQVPRENFRINDYIRAYVLDVRKSPKGPTVILSRGAEGLVQRLLEFEVPEIEDGIVEIMAIAREPG
ncbi:MAG: S1 RNA-binding domain-containing protein, partial [Candidatus Eremiobacteraeota bacterium]|nr:S1 RNA-binding domain-containing protein [Candidatus Eremiobacteraeota bacterium]